MPGRIEKTVFISYRRTNLPWALAIYQELTHHGYDVFFDYLSIPSGDFEKIIIENIKGRAHFVVILTPSSLERCHEPGDWLRRETETAIDEKRNIVPLLLENFDFGSPSITKALTGKLEKLKKYNGLHVHSEYFFEGMNRLRDQFLNVALDAVVHPISENVKPITKKHQRAASKAVPVEKDMLLAQEWLERAYLSKNVEEMIRCLTEAIRLDPELADAYTGRGLAYSFQGDDSKALLDLETAVKLTGDDEHAFIGRGILRYDNNDLDGAIQDFNEAIHFNPTLFNAYLNRGRAFVRKSELDSGIADFTEAIRLKPDEAVNYHLRALAYEQKLAYSSAISDYQKFLELGGEDQENEQKDVERKIKNLKSKLTKKNSIKKTK